MKRNSKSHIFGMALLCVVLLLQVTIHPASAADCTWNGTTGDWNTAGNWSCGAVPGSGDTAIINGGVVNLTTDVTVLNLTLAGGTLQGNANITTTGTLNWSNGTMGGSGATTVTGALNLNSGNGKVLLRTLNNMGTANWYDGGAFWLKSPGIFNNQSGATFTVNNTANLATDGAEGTFNNAGTFTKTSSGATTVIDFFNNTGTVNLNSGTFELQRGGTHSGSFNVASGTTLRLTGDTHTFNSGANLTGAGTVDFYGGTTNVNSIYNITGATTVSGATTNFNAAATVQSVGSPFTISGGTANMSSGEAISTNTLTLSGGTLTGSDNVAATTFNWSYGWMSGSGTTTASSTLNMSSGNVKSLSSNRTLNNAGTATWNDSGSFFITSPAVFNNQSGATFTVNNTAYLQCDTTPGTFNNAGAFTKTSSGATPVIVIFNNTGTVNLNSGTLELQRGGTHTGPVNVASGTTLRLSGDTHTFNSGANLTGAGTVEFYGGTVNVNSIYNITGATTVSGGTTNFNAAATVQSVGSSFTISGGTANMSSGEAINTTTLTISGGTLTGSDNVTATTFNWTYGWMSGSGTTTVTSALNMNSGNYKSLYGNRTLNNARTATWNDAGSFYISSPAVFNNQSGATFTVNNAAYLQYSSSPGTFNNAGVFTKASSGTTPILVAFAGSGTFDFPTGTVEFYSTYNTTGTTIIHGGTTNFNSATSVTFGNLSLSSGALFLHDAAITGNYYFGGGTLNLDNGTFTFSGVASPSTLQTFTGSTTFYNLSVASTAAVETWTSLMRYYGTYTNNGQIRHTPTSAVSCGTAEKDATNQDTATLSNCSTLTSATIKSAAGGGFPNVTIGSSLKYGDCPASRDLVRRYWEITPDTSGTADVIFRFRDSELNGVSPSAIYAFRCVGSSWQQVAGPLSATAADGNGYRTVTATGISIGSGYSLGPSNPTAVTVSSFTARVEEDRAASMLALSALGLAILGALGVVIARRA